MKTTCMRRAFMLANGFNLLVAIYFIIISIIALVQLRWYLQLTITIRADHFVTSNTSYFAFLILLFAALVLIVIFVTSTVSLSPRSHVKPTGQDAGINLTPNDVVGGSTINTSTNQPAHLLPKSGGSQEHQVALDKQSSDGPTCIGDGGGGGEGSQVSPTEATQINNITRRWRTLVFKGSTSNPSQSSVCFSILLHLISSVSLIVVIVIWLLNTAIDFMQDVNNCCGSLDYTDSRHQRFFGLSSDSYPGSCCGKNIYATNARVICTPEEIFRAKQTTGCVTVLADYYHLIALIVVPFAFASLIINIVTIIAMIAILKGYSFRKELPFRHQQRRSNQPPDRR